MSSPTVNSKPCANHDEGSVTRQHCPPEPGKACPLGLDAPACHVAAYCRRCDHQWVAPCTDHQGAVA